MPGRELIEVTNGPDKADLMRALSDVEGRLRVSFDTPVDPVEANVDALQEIGDDGVKLALRGHLASDNLRAVFVGTYDSQTRTGRLVLRPT
jgi:hypothetical protein